MFLLSVVLPRSLRTGVGRGAVGNCSLCVCLATCSSASQPCNIRGWADTSVCCEKVQAIMSEGRKGCGGVTEEFPAAQTWGFLLGANTPCFLAAAACSLPFKKVCVCCCEFCVSKLGLSSSAVHVGAFCLVLLGRVSTVCMRGHRRQAVGDLSLHLDRAGDARGCLQASCSASSVPEFFSDRNRIPGPCFPPRGL